jgi:integrase
MKVPLEVKHKHLVARIVCAPSDDLYHATFTVGGKRIKRAAKTLDKAKSVILEAMKQACKGRWDIASLNGRQLDKLNTAVSLAKANGHQNLLPIVQRYLAFEREAEGMDIFMAIAQFKLSRTCVKAVHFKQAAQGWFDSRKGRWAEDTYKEKQKRLPKVTNAFQIDVCDITHSAIELFFKDLQTLSPKTRNHFREILRGILGYSVEREWLEHARYKRLDTLLKSESAPSAAPKILTLPEFTYLLENADHELLPIIALGGFAGIRPAEIRRMQWEHVWNRKTSVEVEASRAKTRQRRLIERVPVLEAWLSPYKNLQRKIWKHNENIYNKRFNILKTTQGIQGHNLLRHSFASYRLEMLNGDANKLAYEMGNSPDIIFRNYRELVELKQAEEWFSIYPQEHQSKIINIA